MEGIFRFSLRENRIYNTRIAGGGNRYLPVSSMNLKVMTDTATTAPHALTFIWKARQ
jgi:hypothetical protein